MDSLDATQRQQALNRLISALDNEQLRLLSRTSPAAGRTISRRRHDDAPALLSLLTVHVGKHGAALYRRFRFAVGRMNLEAPPLPWRTVDELRQAHGQALTDGLFNMLFNNEWALVAKALAFRDGAAAPYAPVRLRIVVDEHDGLLTLPWQRLSFEGRALVRDHWELVLGTVDHRRIVHSSMPAPALLAHGGSKMPVIWRACNGCLRICSMMPVSASYQCARQTGLRQRCGMASPASPICMPMLMVPRCPWSAVSNRSLPPWWPSGCANRRWRRCISMWLARGPMRLP